MLWIVPFQLCREFPTYIAVHPLRLASYRSLLWSGHISRQKCPRNKRSKKVVTIIIKKLFIFKVHSQIHIHMIQPYAANHHTYTKLLWWWLNWLIYNTTMRIKKNIKIDKKERAIIIITKALDFIFYALPCFPRLVIIFWNFFWN